MIVEYLGDKHGFNQDPISWQADSLLAEMLQYNVPLQIQHAFMVQAPDAWLTHDSDGATALKLFFFIMFSL